MSHRPSVRCLRRAPGVSPTGVAAAAAALLAMAAALASSAWAGGKDVAGVVNINTALPDLLALLPGIGPSKARAIVTYRARHAFRTVDEMVRVKGIGRRMVRDMRAHLAVSGPSTLHLSGTRGPEPPPPALAPSTSRTLPLCRPAPAPPPARLPAGRGDRGAERRALRSAANHCALPS